MSRMGLAEACAPSVVIPSSRDVTPAPYRDRGTALHKYLADVDALGPAKALELVPEAYLEDAKAIDLDALPHTEAGAWGVEVAFAFDIERSVARELHRGGSRDYSMVLDGELPGTADLVGLTPDEVVVLDVKTGHGDLGRPEESMQLLSLAVAAASAYGRKQARVGWIRLVDGLPRFSVSTLDAAALRAASVRVARVWDAAMIAEIQHQAGGAQVLEFVSGPHCKHCPALSRCPAKVTLAREASRLIDGTTPLSIPHDQLGALWNWKEALQAVVDRVEAYLRERIEAEGPALMPNGKDVLGLKQVKREFVNAVLAREVLAELAPELLDAVTEEVKVTCSKSSILDAIRKKPLPPGVTMTKRRDDVVDALRRRGAMYESTSTTLAPHRPALPKGEVAS